ncbi:coth-domain-containing protein [Anaeromyces robustus]|uniref:Coth-domain-containing protein n=1 Tax=Anaeromyces robustus TaxID=1754192 RepID=A0A1Y1WPX3_9FUNG|nr:coth-domain-containing protein [Anaeromyces robustus]|eukprot:ORX75338.1 coth-domain-containing protein [Anaeromyces robustus]
MKFSRIILITSGVLTLNFQPSFGIPVHVENGSNNLSRRNFIEDFFKFVGEQTHGNIGYVANAPNVDDVRNDLQKMREQNLKLNRALAYQGTYFILKESSEELGISEDQIEKDLTSLSHDFNLKNSVILEEKFEKEHPSEYKEEKYDDSKKDVSEQSHDEEDEHSHNEEDEHNDEGEHSHNDDEDEHSHNEEDEHSHNEEDEHNDEGEHSHNDDEDEHSHNDEDEHSHNDEDEHSHNEEDEHSHNEEDEDDNENEGSHTRRQIQCGGLGVCPYLEVPTYTDKDEEVLKCLVKSIPVVGNFYDLYKKSIMMLVDWMMNAVDTFSSILTLAKYGTPAELLAGMPAQHIDCLVDKLSEDDDGAKFYKYVRNVVVSFTIYTVVSETPFIPKGQRAEIFELTDNEVAVFRVTIPKDEFASLKRKANFITTHNIESKNIIIEKTIKLINSQNFNKLFPGNDFKKLLPDLPLDTDGYPTINYTKYLVSDYNFENLILEYYVSFTMFKIFNDNSYLNLINVFYVLSGLDISSSETVDENFIHIMNIFGKDKVTKDENGKYYLLDKDEDEDYYEFPFEYDSYDEYYERKKKREIYDNNNIKLKNNLKNREYEEYNDDDFKKLLESYDFSKYDNPVEEEVDEFDFSTKNGNMIVELNKKKSSFEKITFSLGGHFSRNFAKPGYNIKIRGGKELYGRRQFKLRSDPADPTYLRSKLVSDIHNRLGIPSLSANYATLYINDEYMGLFILTDAYKETWIEYVYGEKDTKLLYKCNTCDLTYETRNGFENENNKVTDRKELYEFLAAMTTAQSSSDVESIFDVDQFIKEIALEYLTSAWDNFMNQHNYYIYKNYKNNKWIYLAYDFDLDLGLNTYETDVTTTQNFDELSYPSLVEKLILNDFDRFNNTIKDIVTNAFNPKTLFSRINKLKAFIKPYVELDKTPDENGKCPGRINLNDDILFSMDQWDESSEFTDIDSTISGLKLFILLKYRYICKVYNIECDSKYLNETVDITTIDDTSLYDKDENNSSKHITPSTFKLLSLLIFLVTMILFK